MRNHTHLLVVHIFKASKTVFMGLPTSILLGGGRPGFALLRAITSGVTQGGPGPFPGPSGTVDGMFAKQPPQPGYSPTRSLYRAKGGGNDKQTQVYL